MIGPGSPVGNFVVTGKLGEGAMGVVYLAEHPKLGRRVAIKVIKKIASDASANAEANAKANEERMSRFVTEAKALSRIRHPNIVGVEDFGVTPDGESYYVMEHLTGESLGTRLRSDGQVSLRLARHVGAQIADALEACHRETVLHRDLKPDNIFLVDHGTDDAFVKVLDFGLAKLMGSDQALHLTQTGAFLGTPLYMSPEQCLGQRDIDARSDVYALGVILFEMVCGCAPFQGASFAELVIKITSGERTSPTTFRRDCPAWLADLILQALATDPSKRPRDMAVVRDRLRESRSERTIAQVAPTTAPIEPTLPAAVPPAAVPPAAVLPAAMAATAPLPGSPPPSGPVGPTSPVPAQASIPTAQAVTLTHSKSAAVIAGRRKGACASNAQNEPQFTHANHFYRVFELSEFGITSEFTAERVDFGVDSAETVAGFQTVTLRLYKLSGAALTNAGLTLLYGQNVLVEDVSQTIMSVPLTTPVVVPAGSTLVLELATPGFATVGNFFYPGSNEAGETGPSYLKASACNISEPSPYTSLDATTPIHLVMRVVGRATGVDARTQPGALPAAGNVAAAPTVVAPDTRSAGNAVTGQAMTEDQRNDDVLDSLGGAHAELPWIDVWQPTPQDAKTSCAAYEYFKLYVISSSLRLPSIEPEDEDQLLDGVREHFWEDQSAVIETRDHVRVFVEHGLPSLTFHRRWGRWTSGIVTMAATLRDLTRPGCYSIAEMACDVTRALRLAAHLGGTGPARVVFGYDPNKLEAMFDLSDRRTRGNPQARLDGVQGVERPTLRETRESTWEEDLDLARLASDAHTVAASLIVPAVRFFHLARIDSKQFAASIPRLLELSLDIFRGVASP